MSDQVDQANQTADYLVSVMIGNAKRHEPIAKHTGYCLYCGEPTKDIERRWCDTDCKYGAIVENGYSNWTVMGADLFCLKKAHPDGEFDIFYSESKELKYAEKCDHFTKGESGLFDVEGETSPEEAFNGDKELIALGKTYEAHRI